MSDETREQSLRAIAHLATEIRTASGAVPWNYAGILGALHRGIPPTKTIAQVARATLWFAEHRVTQDTPLMLSEDGRHWHLDDDETTPALPPKPKCLTEPMGDPVDAQVMANARARIRDARRAR